MNTAIYLQEYSYLKKKFFKSYQYVNRNDQIQQPPVMCPRKTKDIPGILSGNQLIKVKPYLLLN